MSAENEQLQLKPESSFGDLFNMRRNDSELAFQDFLKRIPSSSNLAYLSSGGPSMGNLLDAAMPPPSGSHPGVDGAPGQRDVNNGSNNNGKPGGGGLMSGMPRVSSLDFLARLVCSNPMPASSNPAPHASHSNAGPAPTIKLEPQPNSTGPLQQQEDLFKRTPPAPLGLPNMSPIDLQGLNFPHLPPSLSSALQNVTGLPNVLPSLPNGLPNFPGLPGLPGAGGLDLGGLPHLHPPHANPTQAAAAALQLQGQLGHVGCGPAHHQNQSPNHHGVRQPPHQHHAAPSQDHTQHHAPSQNKQGGTGNSARHSSKPSSTAGTGSGCEDSDGADNLKGGRGGSVSNKRARRMLSNRESARRSRKRKQEHLGRLEEEIQQLKESKQQLQDSNMVISQHLASANDHNKRLQDENERLKDELQFLRSEIQSQWRQGPGEDGNKKERHHGACHQ